MECSPFASYSRTIRYSSFDFRTTCSS